MIHRARPALPRQTFGEKSSATTGLERGPKRRLDGGSGRATTPACPHWAGEQGEESSVATAIHV